MPTRMLHEYVIVEPVTGLSGLKAIDTTAIQNNVIVSTFEFGTFYLDATATDTPDDLNIVQPTTGPGRWIRLTPASTFVNASQKILMDYIYTAGGQTGGMTLSGGNGASENLIMQSTANATKGYTRIGANGLYIDETLANNSVSIGTQVSTFAGTHMMMSAVRDGTNYDGNYLATYSASNANAPSMIYAKSRGTFASPTIVQSNDGLGVMVFMGYDGTNYRQAAQIWGIAGNSITPGSIVSGRLEFDTADSSGVMNTVMNLDASKNTNIFGAFRPNNDAGTSGYVLMTQGASTYPVWSAGVNAINSASTTINVSAATAPTSGQVLTATSGTAATWQTPSGGGGMTWTEVTTTSQACAVNNGYIANNAGLVTFTLPVTAAVGDIIAIVGLGAGGWGIDYNTGQNIVFDGVFTSTTSGVLESNNQYDCVELICVVADTTFSVRSAVSSGLILT